MEREDEIGPTELVSVEEDNNDSKDQVQNTKSGLEVDKKYGLPV
jgi:hypothetical protein